MNDHDLVALREAKSLLDDIVASRYLGVQLSSTLPLANFGELSPAEQEAELRLRLEEELGSRVRAAIHLCLSAASVAVEVGHALMEKFSEVDGEERAALLARCAEDAEAASDAAHHAAAVLAHKEPPETDSFRVLKSEIEIAPVFHRLPERIKAHASICFMALIVYRVMRQRLKLAGSDLSPEAALADLRRIQQHTVSIDNGSPIRGVSTVQPHQAQTLAALKIQKPTIDTQLTLL